MAKRKPALTVEEAMGRLWESDHAILTVKAAYEIADAFGVDRKVVPVATITDNRSDPKGAELFGGKEGDKAEGVCAAEFAEALCDHWKLAYERKLGRGSRLRVACEALHKFIRPVKPEVKPKVDTKQVMRDALAELNRKRDKLGI